MSKQRICRNDKCSKPAGKGRTVCHACRARAYKERHPMRVAYTKQRSNAIRRGKAHDLTFEQFKQFAIATDYMKNKGRSATCYHIDRIDETKGYTADNIQVLTNRQNNLKYRVSLQSDYNFEEGKMEHMTYIAKPMEPEDDDPAPF